MLSSNLGQGQVEGPRSPQVPSKLWFWEASGILAKAYGGDLLGHCPLRFHTVEQETWVGWR